VRRPEIQAGFCNVPRASRLSALPARSSKRTRLGLLCTILGKGVVLHATNHDAIAEGTELDCNDPRLELGRERVRPGGVGCLVPRRVRQVSPGQPREPARRFEPDENHRRRALTRQNTTRPTSTTSRKAT